MGLKRNTTVSVLTGITTAGFLLLLAAGSVGQPAASALQPTVEPTPTALFGQPTPTPIPTATSIFDAPATEATPTPLFVAPTVEPTATPLFTVPTEIPTREPTTTPIPEPTATATPRPAPPRAAATAVPEPTNTPEPELTATPVPAEAIPDEPGDEPTEARLENVLECPSIVTETAQVEISLPSDVADLIATDSNVEITLGRLTATTSVAPSGAVAFSLDGPLDVGTYELVMTGELLDGSAFTTNCSLSIEARAPVPTATASATTTATSESSGSQLGADSEQSDADVGTAGDDDGDTSPAAVTATVPPTTSGGPNRLLLGVVGIGLLALVVVVSVARFFVQR